MRPIALLLAACTADKGAPPAVDTAPTSTGANSDACTLVTLTSPVEGGGSLAEGTFLEQSIYDPEGRILSHVEDMGADGTVEYHEDWTYDTAGDPATHVSYWGEESPGYQRSLTTYSYDGAHHLLLTEQDAWADGSVEKRWTYTWEGDLLTAEAQESNGEIWYEGTDSYDDNGHLLLRSLDYPTAAFTMTWKYTWEDGLQQSESYDDSSANLGPERITWWSWDAQGREILEEIDDGSESSSAEGADGQIDYQYTSTWEGEDRTVREGQSPDGQVWSRTTWSHDAQHRVTEMVTTTFDQSGEETGTTDLQYAYAEVGCP